MADISHLAVAAAIVGGLGSVLLLSELRWFRRVPMMERLAPFSETTTGNATVQTATFRTALAPFASTLGARLSSLFGAGDDLSQRLRRAGSSISASDFRLKQLGWCALALMGALLVSVALQTPLPVTGLLLIGAPLLAFLIVEQQSIAAAKRVQKQLFEELPVISEQLAMLLSAGYSLNAALSQMTLRNDGIAARGITQVVERNRHGLTTNQALREWADLMEVPELHRLVAVLALANETNDLGRLVSDETQHIRRESYRNLSESIERRAQQVWVPVTVATLIPGVIFLTVPFLQALRLFSG